MNQAEAQKVLEKKRHELGLPRIYYHITLYYSDWLRVREDKKVEFTDEELNSGNIPFKIGKVWCWDGEAAMYVLEDK